MQSHELDIVLLKVEDSLNLSVNIFDNFEYRVPLIDEELKLCMQNLSYTNDGTMLVKYNILDCINKYISFERQTSFNIPLLPFINLTLSELEDESISGISGTLILNKRDQIVGMVTCLNSESNIVSVIPCITIERFLKEFIKHNVYMGLCDIIAKMDACEIEDDDSNIINCFIVNDNYNIKYSSNTLTYPAANSVNLKKKDMIYKIANLDIGKDQCIFFEKINHRVPVPTYIALNYIADETIQLHVLRECSDDFEEKEININARPIWSAKYINIPYNNKFINLSGFIFIELCEELIDLYRNHNIVLSGSIIKHITESPFRNTDDSVLVLIDILRNKFLDDEIKKIDAIGLPLHNISLNQYSLAQVQKVNKRRIKNIDMFSDVIRNNHNISIRLNLNDKFNIRLNFNECTFDFIEIATL